MSARPAGLAALEGEGALTAVLAQHRQRHRLQEPHLADDAVAAGKASPEPDSNALFRNMNQVAEGIVIRGVDSGARTTLATVQP